MPIDIYEHTNYRRYLQAWLEHPDTPTAAAFASAVGSSTAMVSSVKNGKRDLDATKVTAWSRGLGHDEDEARYFVALVELESSSKLRREAAQAHVRVVQRYRSAEKVDDKRLDVYLVWYYAAILELAHCRSFRPDPEWIAARLTPPITAEQAREALSKLLETELLRREGDSLVPVDVMVTPTEIPPGKVSAASREYHLSALDRAARALEETPGPERHLSTQTVSLPQSAIPYLKARMEEVDKELIAYCAGLPDRDRVYQFSFVLFPVSRSTDEEDEG